MSKITLTETNSGYNLQKINSNFQKIADEFNDKVLYRDNLIGEPNRMHQDMDMDGNTIFNLPEPNAPNQVATKRYVDDIIDPSVNPAAQDARESASKAKASELAAKQSELNALGSEVNAAQSVLQAQAQVTLAEQEAIAAAQSAIQAEGYSLSAASFAATAHSYSELGLGGAAGVDLGFVSQAAVIFPSDFGTLV